MLVAYWIAAVAVFALLAGMVGALEAADRIAALVSRRYASRRTVRLQASTIDLRDNQPLAWTESDLVIEQAR
jgi:hypothetical protein